MQQLTLQNILALAGKTTNTPFTPQEMILLKSKVQYLILQRKMLDNNIYTSIIPIIDINIGYGKNRKKDTKQRIICINFNIIDTEKKTDFHWGIHYNARYMFSFTVAEDGLIQRTSSSGYADSEVSQIEFYIQ